MFQRILVPLDGSVRAEQAFPVAVRIAHATGASLTLLRVVESPNRFDEHSVELPEEPAELLEAEIARAKAYLLHVLAESKLEGIGITTEVRTGVVAQHILQCVEEHQDDLIVMCSHGTTGLKRWLLGSVAQKIVHTSPVPVLIVREGHALLIEQQGVTKEPFQILVPLDGSALAEAALLPAAHMSAALAAPQSGALHLVQVVEPIAVMGDITGAVAELKQEAMLWMRSYLKG
ncbi:MAG: universal stress protein, partial [Ktedonobacteraceae bacterium]|nr:universal stress protein [Ktedonobacteraceae bacterium]